MKRIALFSCLLLLSAASIFAVIKKKTANDGYEWYQVEENGLYGLADEKGNIIVPAKYDLFVYHSSGKYFGAYTNYGKSNQKKSAWTLDGRCIIPDSKGYDDFFYSSVDGFNIEKKGKYIALGITMDDYYSNGDSSSKSKSSTNLSSNTRTKNTYHGTTSLPLTKQTGDNGFIWYEVKDNGLYGAADENGNLLIPIKYDLLVYHNTNGGYFNGYINYGESNQTTSVWDLYGNCIISENRKYSEIVRHTVDEYHVHWYSVRRGNGRGACNASGEEIIAPNKQYDKTLFFSTVDNMFNTEKNGKYISIGITLDLSTPTYSDKYQPVDGGDSKPQQNYLAQNNTNTEPKSTGSEKFSTYAQRVVTNQVKEWQKKDEFETTDEWSARVNETTQKQKIESLLEDARREYVSKYSPTNIKANIGKYDADNGIFPITTIGKGTIYVAVPRAEAPTFKKQWSKVTLSPKYGIMNDTIGILSCNFTLGKSIYKSTNDYIGDSSSDIADNLPKIEINIQDSSTPSKRNLAQTPVKKKKVIDNSIDKNIPVNKTDNNITFAIIIGNENYQAVAKVPFAANDAKVFAEYCNKTLGIPEKNIKVFQDASFGKILSAISYLQQISEAFEGKINIIFYYAGHGIPNEADKSAYLLPIDADGTQTEVCYSIDRLYSELSETGAESVVVFLDACFSGSQRGNGMVASARGVAIKPRTAEPKGNMVVFSAATGNQTAYPYEEKGHGMFTYFLLDKLKTSNGNATLKEIGDYVTSNVRQQSVVINSKAQIPTITPSSDLSSWETLKLR